MSKDNEKYVNARGRSFTSDKFKRYEAYVYNQAYCQMKNSGKFMFIEPLFVRMGFFFKNNVRLDLFNAPKSICDALNGAAWKDDKLIVFGELRIVIDPKERVEIEVMSYEFYQYNKLNGNI